MTDDKRNPGRPRLYENSSAKLSAFRKRQETAGYLRKEVLVTPETTDKLALLAKTHNVSALDVASALLEHGLSRYEAEQSSFIGLASSSLQAATPALPVTYQDAQGSLRSMSGVSANAGLGDPVAFASASQSPLSSVLSASSSSLSSNPIHNFFAKRKESKND